MRRVRFLFVICQLLKRRAKILRVQEEQMGSFFSVVVDKTPCNWFHWLDSVPPCYTQVRAAAEVTHSGRFWPFLACKCQSFKVENILKGSLDSIPSPSLSVKIQIMCGKVCLGCKGKTLLGVVNKLLKTKSLLTSPSNVLPYYLK